MTQRPRSVSRRNTRSIAETISTRAHTRAHLLHMPTLSACTSTDQCGAALGRVDGWNRDAGFLRVFTGDSFRGPDRTGQSNVKVSEHFKKGTDVCVCVCVEGEGVLGDNSFNVGGCTPTLFSPLLFHHVHSLPGEIISGSKIMTFYFNEQLEFKLVLPVICLHHHNHY